MPTPKGEMVVVAVKAQKQTRDKATVWVEFLSPPSHVGKQIQLYPKSLEPRNGPAQGADFSLLTAISPRGRVTLQVTSSAADDTLTDNTRSIELMRYLVRLVTPNGGTVLDPFMGSGSTGCAAMLEGMDFIGIDITPEYVEIARRRILHHANQNPMGLSI